MDIKSAVSWDPSANLCLKACVFDMFKHHASSMQLERGPPNLLSSDDLEVAALLTPAINGQLAQCPHTDHASLLDKGNVHMQTFCCVHGFRPMAVAALLTLAISGRHGQCPHTKSRI